MAWADRCKEHCDKSYENAEVTYEYKDPHGRTTTHYECKECGHEWRED